jgi:hypothetical protein
MGAGGAEAPATAAAEAAAPPATEAAGAAAEAAAGTPAAEAVAVAAGETGAAVGVIGLGPLLAGGAGVAAAAAAGGGGGGGTVGSDLNDDPNVAGLGLDSEYTGVTLAILGSSDDNGAFTDDANAVKLINAGSDYFGKGIW